MTRHQSYNTSHNTAQITMHGYTYKSITKRPNGSRQVRNRTGYQNTHITASIIVLPLLDQYCHTNTVGKSLKNNILQEQILRTQMCSSVTNEWHKEMGETLQMFGGAWSYLYPQLSLSCRWDHFNEHILFSARKSIRTHSNKNDFTFL